LKRDGRRPPPLRNASYRFESQPDGFSFVHRLNLYGFRDDDWSRKSPLGVRRVAFIGDSFTEGAGAPEGSTIVDAFDAAGGDAVVESMNLGIQGTGLRQYLRLMGDAVPLFHPDYVVLILMANDFGNMARPDVRLLPARPPSRTANSPLRPRLSYLLANALRGRSNARAWHGSPFPFFPAIPDPRNPWSRPRERSRLEPWVAPELVREMENGRFNPWLPLGHEEEKYWFSRPSPIGSHLGLMKDFLLRHNCRLMVVFFPSEGQVSDAYIKYHARYNPPGITSIMAEQFQQPARDTAAACRSLDLPFLDLTPMLRAWEAAGRRCYWSYDNHPRPDTYVEVGKLVYQQFRQAFLTAR
jgi:hypothetical protein